MIQEQSPVDRMAQLKRQITRLELEQREEFSLNRDKKLERKRKELEELNNQVADLGSGSSGGVSQHTATLINKRGRWE